MCRRDGQSAREGASAVRVRGRYSHTRPPAPGATDGAETARASPTHRPPARPRRAGTRITYMPLCGDQTAIARTRHGHSHSHSRRWAWGSHAMPHARAGHIALRALAAGRQSATSASGGAEGVQLDPADATPPGRPAVGRGPSAAGRRCAERCWHRQQEQRQDSGIVSSAVSSTVSSREKERRMLLLHRGTEGKEAETNGGRCYDALPPPPPIAALGSRWLP